MSIKNWPGGLINKTPPTPSGPYQNSTAPGVWTLDQQAYWQKQGLWPTAGSVDPSLFIENLFSTYLYTGNASTQTITNNIDLAGKGGLIWIKDRTLAAGHRLTSTNMSLSGGAYQCLTSNGTNALLAYGPDGVTAFNNNGFSVKDTGSGGGSGFNASGSNYASWTFREQAKFFDVVTYTGNGVSGRTIAHNLGSVPGFIIVKSTSTATIWAGYHRSLGATQLIRLNTTDAATTNSTMWNNTEPTSTVFSVGNAQGTNQDTLTYVAYLFAHDAGGFGLTGTDNVISCGSWTGTGTSPGPTTTLGYEPQWIIWKRTDAGTESWHIRDNMRGMPVTASGKDLYANLSDAEGSTTTEGPIPTATGFQIIGTNTNANASGATYIYIAIRRGPMKTPTTGTSVFGLSARTGTGANATVTGGQTDDVVLIKNRGAAVGDLFASRLTGTGYLETSSTAAEVAAGATILQANPWDVMDGVKLGTTSTITNASANTFINYLFRRSPGFFDVVCYTGTLTTLNVSHNLGAVPQLIITKSRSAIGNWTVQPLSNGTQRLRLNTTAAQTSDAGPWNNTNPTNSVFTLGADTGTNSSGVTYVAYLFATVAGVSKVGSYTGTAALQTIDCGFASGARFVLIKRTDATGDWYVWDSARGISSSTDPYLLLNSTAAEVTGTNYVDTTAVGFQVTAAAPAAINANGGSFVFLAIA